MSSAKSSTKRASSSKSSHSSSSSSSNNHHQNSHQRTSNRQTHVPTTSNDNTAANTLSKASLHQLSSISISNNNEVPQLTVAWRQSIQEQLESPTSPIATYAANRRVTPYKLKSINNTHQCDKFGFIIDENNSPNSKHSSTNSNLSNDATTTPNTNNNNKKQPSKTANSNSNKTTNSANNNSYGEDEVPISKLIKREAKWLNMINNWDLWIDKEFEKVCSRCRKGIPSSIRGKAWFYLSGAHLTSEKNPRLFKKLEHEPGDPSICEDIRKDLHRQFPNHELFYQNSGVGQQSLFSVLKAFSIVRKEIGYCQGLAPVASMLIMQMAPDQAFWTLLSLSDNFIPGYYNPGFSTILLHGSMLFGLLKKYSPTAYRILKRGEIEPQLVMLEWFMCLFVRNLPWPTVLRLWDMFLCEGIIVIFKAAIIIITTTVRKEFKDKDPVDLLQILRHLPEQDFQESKFIPRVIKLDLTTAQLNKEHIKHLQRLRLKK